MGTIVVLKGQNSKQACLEPHRKWEQSLHYLDYLYISIFSITRVIIKWSPKHSVCGWLPSHNWTGAIQSFCWTKPFLLIVIGSKHGAKLAYLVFFQIIINLSWSGTIFLQLTHLNWICLSILSSLSKMSSTCCSVSFYLSLTKILATMGSLCFFATCSRIFMEVLNTLLQILQF